uniref:Uncharacterized protein n=1 Tax=Clytia hemisphaerica TaxID=252671 RepID=A0A7M5UVQ2_9CNID
MISIEAYRACIGSFAFTAQRNVKGVCKSIVIDSFLCNNAIFQIFRPMRFVALLFFLFVAIPKSYEITFFETPLVFLHLSRNGMFVPYPNVTYGLIDSNLIFMKVNYTLLLSGDIELNPGPRTDNSKIVQGNFNQAHEMFGVSADKQSATNSLFSICWTKVRKINIWKDFDLDFILHSGDEIFKDTSLNRSLTIDEIPQRVVI